MRLSKHQCQIIRQTVADCFGPEARVYLFGSRGGDIDLLIETDMTDVDEIVRAEIQFQVRVQQRLGEQKIDLLIDYSGRGEHPPIFAVAERTGVPL